MSTLPEPHGAACAATKIPSRILPPLFAMFAMLALAAPVSPTAAHAALVVTGIHRTGETVPVTMTARAANDHLDPYWHVVALPQTDTVDPYAASVFSGRGPSFKVPTVWYMGANGIDGAGWIGVRESTANSLYPPAVGARSDYTMIYATTFEASGSGVAYFDLMATADNALSLFVNGSIDGRATMTPSIVGGAQIGVEKLGLGVLHAFKGLAEVRQGENTLYAVVRDRYILNPATKLGGYGQTGLFVATVPEPGTFGTALLGAAICLAGGVTRAIRRRRLRCRPRGH